MKLLRLEDRVLFEAAGAAEAVAAQEVAEQLAREAYGIDADGNFGGGDADYGEGDASPSPYGAIVHYTQMAPRDLFTVATDLLMNNPNATAADHPALAEYERIMSSPMPAGFAESFNEMLQDGSEFSAQMKKILGEDGLAVNDSSADILSTDYADYEFEVVDDDSIAESDDSSIEDYDDSIVDDDSGEGAVPSAPNEIAEGDEIDNDVDDDFDDDVVVIDGADGAAPSQNSAPSLIIINSSVLDADKIIAALGDNPNVEILRLESGSDALQQILDYLNSRNSATGVGGISHEEIVRNDTSSGNDTIFGTDGTVPSRYSSLQIVSHGNAGYFVLNGQVIDAEFVAANAEAFKAISAYFTDDADMLLYGCNLAGDSAGQDLVNQLSAITGMDVAASIDTTGAGGNWTLEYVVGTIETANIVVDGYEYSLASFTITVTSNADTGAGSLREAITTGITTGNEYIINFNIAGSDTIALVTSLNFGVTGATISINGANIATGNNITISGGWSGGANIDGVRVMFLANNGTFNLTNLVIKDGYAGGTTAYGAGIAVTGTSTVNITNCIIENNKVTGTTNGYGGGIGIGAAATVNITNTIIRNNIVSHAGGGINIGGGTVTITNSTIDNNFAAGGGGGIYNGSTNTKIIGSTITNNQATGVGAGGSGGGIYAAANTLIDHCKISDNIANSAGGAIAIANSITLTITNTTFDNNEAKVAASSSGYSGGGGIFFISSGAKATITDSFFTNNRVTGANGSAGVGNGSGGGIWSNSSELVINNTTFSGNTVVANGAGIYVALGTTIVNNSTIGGNVATLSGGGIFINSGTVNINNSTIADNKVTTAPANNGGGGIYIANATVSVTNSTISGNTTNSTSWVGGGGIFACQGTLNLINSTISGNNGGNFGGGLLIGGNSTTYAPTVNIVNSTISGNIAASGGGFITLYTGAATNVNILNSIIVGNYASTAINPVANDIVSFDNLNNKGNIRIAHSVYGVVSDGAAAINRIQCLLNTGAYANYAVALANNTNIAVDMATGVREANMRAIFTTVTAPVAGRWVATLSVANGKPQYLVLNPDASNPANPAIGVHTAFDFTNNRAAYWNGTTWTIIGAGTFADANGVWIIADQRGQSFENAPSRGAYWISNNATPAITVNDNSGSVAVISGVTGLNPTTATITIARALSFAGKIGSYHTIKFDQTVFATNSTIILSGAIDFSTFGLTNRTIIIDGDLTNSNAITLQATSTTRAFNIAVAGNFTLKNMAITGGIAHSFTGTGGGINIATGNVTLDTVTISGFTATTNGGGIYVTSGTLTITNSTISGNKAVDGGGFYVNAATAVNVINSTMVNNVATSRGGGFYVNAGTVNLLNSTITSNGTASGNNGGGVAVNDANSVLNVVNSIIYGNYAGSGGNDIRCNANTAIINMRYSIYGTISGSPGVNVNTANGTNIQLATSEANVKAVFAYVSQKTIGTTPNLWAADLTYSVGADGNVAKTPTIALAKGFWGVGGGVNSAYAAMIGNSLVYSVNGNNGTWFTIAGNTLSADPTALQKITADQRGIAFDAGDAKNNAVGSYYLSNALAAASALAGFNTIVTTADDRVVDPYHITLRFALANVAAGAANPITFATSLNGISQQLGEEINFSNLLVFGTGTKYAYNVAGITLTGKTVTINGNGVANTIITAANNARVFNINVASAGLAFNNLTITGGNLTVNTGAVSGIITGGGGMWVNNAGANVTLTNCKVSDNELHVTTTINTDTHTANVRGGGIYVSAGNLTLTNSTVSDNKITMTMDGGTNSMRHLHVWGGGICFTGGGTLTINPNSIISGNTAATVLLNGATGIQQNAYGGGIYLDGATANITNTTFTLNNARSGGGLYVTGASTDLTITNATFSQNTALNGGGLTTASTSKVTITGNTIFDNNKATSLTGGGGGLNVGGSANVTLTGTTITNNTADGNGGGISVGSHYLTVNDCTISGNVAKGTGTNYGGGGIHITSNNINPLTLTDVVTINNSTIFNNTALNGGGINFSDGRGNVNNCTIYGNTATLDGGGINFVRAANGSTTIAEVNIINCTIFGNLAANGGGINVTASASSSGAGNGIATANLNLVNTTISGNRATVNGGGLNTMTITSGIGAGDKTANVTVNILNSILLGNYHLTNTAKDIYVAAHNNTATGGIGTGNNTVNMGYSVYGVKSGMIHELNTAHTYVVATSTNVMVNVGTTQANMQTALESVFATVNNTGGSGLYKAVLTVNAPGTTATLALISGSKAQRVGVYAAVDNNNVAYYSVDNTTWRKMIDGTTATVTTGKILGDQRGVNYASNGKLSAGSYYREVYDYNITLNGTVTYNTGAQTVTYTTNSVAAGHTITGSFPTVVNAGTYNSADDFGLTDADLKARFTFMDGVTDLRKDYDVKIIGGAFTVNKATITYTVTAGQTKIYGDANPTYAHTATGFVGSDTEATMLTGFLATTMTTNSNVGNYAITQGTLALVTNLNYTLTFTGASFTVTTRAITLANVNVNNKVYDGNATATFSGYTFNNLVAGDAGSVTLNVTATFTDGKNAGDGKEVAFAGNITGAKAGNYTITDIATHKEYADISKKELIVGTITVDNRAYNGGMDATANYVAGLNVAQIIGTDVGKVELSGTANFATANAGNGKTVNITDLHLHGDEADNYTLNVFTKTATANIAKANITITADSKTKVYGETAVALTYSAVGDLHGHTLAVTIARADNTNHNAGNYAITIGYTIDGGTNANFNVVVTNANYAITARTIHLTADDQFIVAGTAVPNSAYYTYYLSNGSTLGYTDTLAGIITGGGFTSAYATSDINGATRAITVNGLTVNSNYTLITHNGLLTVGTKIALTVKVTNNNSGNNYTQIYGVAESSAYVMGTDYELYNGGTKVTDFTGISGSIQRNGYSVGVAGNVGEYSFTIGTLASANYSFTVDAGSSVKYTITPKTLNITVDLGQTKVYGEANPANYTYTQTGLFGTDSITGKLSRDIGEDFGTYNIKIGTLDAGNNYTINFTAANFTITKRDLIISNIGVQDVHYNGAAQTAIVDSHTYAASTGANGLMAGDNLTLTFVANYTGDISAGINKEVTVNSFTVGGSDVGNYNVKFADGTIINKTFNVGKIDKAHVTVTADAKAKVYGDGVVVLTSQVTFGTLYNGDILTGALSREVGENAGVYAISKGTLSTTNSNNYEINFVEADFTINKKVITVDSITVADKIYDGTKTATITGYTFAAGGVIGGDVVTFSATANFADQNVSGGKINVNITNLSLGGSAGGNYTLSASLPTGMSAYIDPKVLTVSNLVIADKTYDGTTSATLKSATLNGVAAGDNVNVVVALNGGAAWFESKNAGTQYVGGMLGLVGDTNVDRNYILDISSSRFVTTATITQATLTITAANAGHIYGAAEKALTYTYTGGLKNGDLLVDLFLQRASGNNPGTYAITVADLSIVDSAGDDCTNNYRVVMNNAVYTITAKANPTPPNPNPYVPPYVPPVFNNDSKNDNNITASDIYLATASSPYYRPMTGNYDYLYEIPHLAANAIALPTFSARVEMPSHRNPMQGIYSANRGIQPMLTLLERILPMNSSVTNGERTVPSVINGTHRLDVNINEFSDDIKIEGGEEIHWDRLKNINPLPHLSDPDEYVMIDADDNNADKIANNDDGKTSPIRVAKSTIGESIYDLSNDEIAALEPEQIDPELYAALGAIKPNRELYQQIYGIANVFKTDFDRQFDKMMAGIL